MSVVIIPELLEFSLQVRGIPKQEMIEIFAADRSDEPFDEGVGDGQVGYRLNFFDTQNSEIGPPSMKRKQRIII